MTTQDFNELKELPNVDGISEENDGTVIAFVTQKVPESELNDDDIVGNHDVVTDRDTDVVDMGGEVQPHELQQSAESQGLVTREKHRPVVGGVSEMLGNKRGFATGGPLVEVTDTSISTANYDSSVENGDICRLSNNHVYANINSAPFGSGITQPSPPHGGSEDDIVGELCGYVPVKQGVTVDAAIRDLSGEANESYEMIRGDVSGVKRNNFSGMRGNTMTVNGGARTGYDQATVLATSVNVNVNYGKHGVIEIQDCIATKAMTAGGDSGAPASYNSELVALNFAGSKNVSILCKLSNVEDALGVKVRTEAPQDDGDNNNDGNNNDAPSSPEESVWEPLFNFTAREYQYQMRRKPLE
jgi:hypothetical protein